MNRFSCGREAATEPNGREHRLPGLARCAEPDADVLNTPPFPPVVPFPGTTAPGIHEYGSPPQGRFTAKFCEFLRDTELEP